MIEVNAVAAHTLEDITAASLPTSPKSKGFKNFQNLQSPLGSSRWQNSKESIDTECTSDPPDPLDKHSLKLIDDVIEFHAGEQPSTIPQGVDFLPLAKLHLFRTSAEEVCRTAESTLKNHFRKTMKIDKYLRLISAAIKTRRAYQPNSRLITLYKELILARRVIRWECKYDTLVELLQKEEGVGMKAFKIMQLTGDLVDLSAFWLKTVNKGTERRTALIQRLEQTESNFYFAQCVVWLFVYTYRYLKLRKENNDSTSEERKSKLNENLLKLVKYCMDILTSYNNSSLKRVGGEINPKLAGYLTLFSSAIGIFLLWR